MKKSQAGFSILELAIVLTVIALIVSSSLAVAAARMSAAKVESTLIRTQTLIEIIDSYVKTFGQLPCPADPSARPEDANFGVGSSDGAGECTATSLVGQDDYAIGSVPTATLGLMGSSGVDGWNRRFTYVVDKRLTSRDNYLGVWDNSVNPPAVVVPAIGNGSLIVRSATGGTVITNQAIYVLISHGSNGHGSWRAKGGGARLEADPVPGADEIENMDDDGEFVEKLGGEGFDDIVRYRLKWHIQ